MKDDEKGRAAMRAETLIFSWPRFEAARAVDTCEVPPFLPDVPGGPGPTRCLILAASGNGRTWSTRTPQAFWRSFAGIKLGDEDEVLSFVRRYGDVFGDLSNRQTCSTSAWLWLHDALGFVAQAWDKADVDGLSHLSNDPKRLDARLHLFGARDQLQRRDAGFEPAAEPGSATIRLRPKTLGAFMVASAANALDRGVPMRRCGHCGYWFEARRVDMRMCSSSCRAAHSVQAKQKAA
jgi:hypothetical protein